MPNIIDILARALSLRQETALNSITPNRAGGIMYDTLLVLNQMQLEGGALLISKVYASVSAMEADTTPTSDLTGRALKPGQLVVIVTSDTSSSDMGSEYRFNGPGSWTYVGKVGGLPLDTVPTQSSTKGITSGGVYAALSAMKAEGYKYMGIATPGSGGTAPGTPNQPVFYIAGPGSYPNFGSITVASGYLGFIKYSSGSWTVESVAVGKDYDAQISALDGQISALDGQITQLEAKVGKVAIPLLTNMSISTGSTIGSTVNITPSAENGYYCAVFDCNEGDTIIVSGHGGYQTRLWSFVDSSNKLLQVSVQNNTLTSEPITAPANTAKAIINTNINATSYFVSATSLDKQIEQVNEDLQKFETRVGYDTTVSKEIQLSVTPISGLRATNPIAANAASYLYAIPVQNGQTIKGSWSFSSGYVNYGFTAVYPIVGTTVSNGGSGGTGNTGITFDAVADGYLVVSFDTTPTTVSFVVVNTGIGATVADNKELVSSLSNIIGTEVIEFGNITIGSSEPIQYSQSFTRVRTMYGVGLPLLAGDTIKTDGTVEFFYAGKTTDGYKKGGWITELAVEYSGDYCFVARFIVEAQPTDCNKALIGDHIIITTKNYLKVRKIAEEYFNRLANWDRTVRAINHRGYNKCAPENTLPAFKLSRENGFNWVETDIQFTADGKIVCIHDNTVDRTSNGSGNVADMTLAELKALDFGSWFSPSYSGTTIPTFGEFLSYCRSLGLSAYVEIKGNLTQAMAEQIVEEVYANGMQKSVNFVSFYSGALTAISNVDKSFRLGYLDTINQDAIDTMKELGNPVFMDGSNNTQEVADLCSENGIDLEYWLTNNDNAVSMSLLPTICGVTSDIIIAGRSLFYFALSPFELA